MEAVLSPVKACYKCKNRFPRSEEHFYPDLTKRDGLSSKCKGCVADLKEFYKQRRLSSRKAIIAHAKKKPCMDCGQSHPPYVMDFDHVPKRGRKRFSISAALKWSVEDVLEEIAKCDLVCANCHRLRSAKRLEALGGQPPVVTADDT